MAFLWGDPVYLFYVVCILESLYLYFKLESTTNKCTPVFHSMFHVNVKQKGQIIFLRNFFPLIVLVMKATNTHKQTYYSGVAA